MKTRILLLSFLTLTLSCTKSITYSPEHIQKTSGRYLYSLDEVIEVYYENNDLFLKWKGAEKMKPVVLDANTFFVPDMYKKLRFVQHPKTKKWYLGIVSEEDDSQVSYEYLKVADTFKTPSMYLKDKNYDAALVGFMQMKALDSASVFVNEHEFNRMGYNLLNEKAYDDAIAVFKMNVALYPDSDNVYDSLADAYLRSGDSLNAYNNYSKALELNTGNDRAKKYIEAYNKANH